MFGVCFLPETRSQNTEKLSVDQAATVLLNFLQQAREGGEGSISITITAAHKAQRCERVVKTDRDLDEHINIFIKSELFHLDVGSWTERGHGLLRFYRGI